MATLAASVTIFLFLLFTFSRAREIHHYFPHSIPVSLNANHIHQHDTVSENANQFHQHDVVLENANQIHQHDTVSENANQIQQHDTVSENANEIHQHDTVSFSLHTADPVVPLTFVTFRPINRHVPRNPLPLSLSLRTGKRRCRHGHRRPIPYGHDAIVMSDAAVDPSNRGVVRQIPTRWARFQGGARMRFPEVNPSKHHLLLHRKVHGDEGWFSNKIRMFLNMF
ncbi:hypothetical protein TanjilG_10951 [Lupinus angustifolius]|uniref:Uncharacterized protein n=1 Tax=Lupinus angustifolius TaxID=3871 RepID=A0A1J7IC66_LUPAN|nr:PREDICTED: uncharacterized protein LOC109347939 [Lupinus angustifolius]OIW11749.1 hypothetical protein TanjilG_10951 [Lupinus angustifolius]